jgi:hypothetical protein
MDGPATQRTMRSERTNKSPSFRLGIILAVHLHDELTVTMNGQPIDSVQVVIEIPSEENPQTFGQVELSGEWKDGYGDLPPLADYDDKWKTP